MSQITGDKVFCGQSALGPQGGHEQRQVVTGGHFLQRGTGTILRKDKGKLCVNK